MKLNHRVQPDFINLEHQLVASFNCVISKSMTKEIQFTPLIETKHFCFSIPNYLLPIADSFYFRSKKQLRCSSKLSFIFLLRI